jgi:ribosomal protein L29
MSFASLTPEQRAELDSLREELRSAELRAAEALRGLGPDHILEGAALTLFEEADHEISEIRRRIAELEGKK